MSQISQIALAGIRGATEKINESASSIASGLDIGNPEPLIEIKQAEISIKANSKLIKVDKELSDSLLDILA